LWVDGFGTYWRRSYRHWERRRNDGSWTLSTPAAPLQKIDADQPHTPVVGGGSVMVVVKDGKEDLRNVKVWSGTQKQLDNIATRDEATLYAVIVD
jgi:hypothetical protein